MTMHEQPVCIDSRTDCNNRTEHGKCIALTESFEHCKFYCSIRDTHPDDVEYHVSGKRQMKTRTYLEQLI